MKVINKNLFPNIFPMKIKCRRVTDSYGFSYGKAIDFCGTDYGIVCPICNSFILIKKEEIPSIIRERAEEIELIKAIK